MGAGGIHLLGLPSDAGAARRGNEDAAGLRLGYRAPVAVRLGVITTGSCHPRLRGGPRPGPRPRPRHDRARLWRFPLEGVREPAALLASDRTFARWRHAFEERDLDVSALAVHGDPLSPDPEIADGYDLEFHGACVLAERLGVPAHAARGPPEGGPGDRTPCWVVTPFPPYNLESSRTSGTGGCFRTGARRPGRRRHEAAGCFEMSPSDMVFNRATLLRLREEVGPSSGATSIPRTCSGRGSIRSRRSTCSARRSTTCTRRTRACPSGRFGSTGCSTPRRTATSPTDLGLPQGRLRARRLVLARLRLGAADGRVRRRRLDRARGRPGRPDEGLAKATALLRGMLVERAVTGRWWESMGRAPEQTS